MSNAYQPKSSALSFPLIADLPKLLEVCIDRLNDAILITEAEPFNQPGPRIVWANKVFYERTGYSPEEVLGQTPRILQGPATDRVTLDRIRVALENWQSVRAETLNYRKDGTTYWNEFEIVPIADEKGWFTHWISVQRDITQRKQIMLDLVKAKETAERANLAKSVFLSTMSHEIRTPMNGVLGMAQLLLLPNLKDDERLDYARTILSSGQALLTLLNDILDLSKIEAGKIQLDSVVFDPVNLLGEIHSLFLGAAQTKNLQLKSQWMGPANQRFQADAHRIRQMISNLVGNAIKFSTQGSVHLEATEIERDLETVLLEFSVTDTGIGIPEDKRDLLFKPFSQTESSNTREFGGSGLGLSIVSQLAKLMGGEVGVESEVGQGSRFWFRVQVKCFVEGEEARRHERAAQDENSSSTYAEQLTGRVLVVEDNMVNRMVIESLLDKLGLKVTLLTDGQQAVDAISLGDQLPDIILMDLHMPVMDGYTAVTLIRQWEADQNRDCLPIIALTADAFEEDRQRCLAVGMDDFLTKPIELNALKSTLGKWLSVKPQF